MGSFFNGRAFRNSRVVVRNWPHIAAFVLGIDRNGRASVRARQMAEKGFRKNPLWVSHPWLAGSQRTLEKRAAGCRESNLKAFSSKTTPLTLPMLQIFTGGKNDCRLIAAHWKKSGPVTERRTITHESVAPYQDFRLA